MWILCFATSPVWLADFPQLTTMCYSGCYGTAPRYMPLSCTLGGHWPLSPTPPYQRAPPASVVAFSWPVLVDVPARLTAMDKWCEAYTPTSTNFDHPAPCCAAGEPQELLVSSSDCPEKGQEAIEPSAQMPQTLQPPPDTQPTQPPAPPLPAPAQAQPVPAPRYPLYPQGRCTHISHWQHLRAKRNHSYFICKQCSKTWRQWRPGKGPALGRSL